MSIITPKTAAVENYIKIHATFVYIVWRVIFLIGLVLISEINAAVWRDWDVLKIASYLNSFLQEVLLYSRNMEILHDV